jgi:hypothetical protein
MQGGKGQSINLLNMNEVLAIWKTFGTVGFSKLAWVVHLECLRKDDGTFYRWESEEQVYPMCKELKNYFHSRAYKRKVKEAMKGNIYSIDWERFETKFEAEMSSMESYSRATHNS